uniref:Uncharacterized protein n=1 Tax=Pandoraea faecigallinarum TaxID=656179 RepID=A0A173GZT8_9BURK
MITPGDGNALERLSEKLTSLRGGERLGERGERKAADLCGVGGRSDIEGRWSQWGKTFWGATKSSALSGVMPAAYD